MTLNSDGMVMHSNPDQLPKECAAISRDYAFTLYASRKYAKPFPDKIFGYSDHELMVEPCSRITVTLVNRDQVRHQWMVHGLPRYLYRQGMFHLEAAGGSEVTGVFIVPGDHATYLIHCDMAQHMEKGMKAQLVVGRGGGNLWAIPGISADFIRDHFIIHPLAGGVSLFFWGQAYWYWAWMLARPRRPSPIFWMKLRTTRSKYSLSTRSLTT